MNTIKSIPSSLRPYEKCLTGGTSALDDAELLAVILRSGTKGVNSVSLAHDILRLAGGSIRELPALGLEELKTLPGVGTVKALQILCVSELSMRISRKREGIHPKFSSPESVADYYMEEMCRLNQEELRVLFMDSGNRLIRMEILSKGSAQETMMPVREILVQALKAGAQRLILMHNHPAGNPEPSKADLMSTNDISAALKICGLTLSDHVIFGDRSYISMFEKGLIP